MIDFQKKRNIMQAHISSGEAVKFFLDSLGIERTKDDFFMVREERTPSCKINKDGSCHDFGSGEHFADIVSLLYDGYQAFDSLPETMEWVCNELGIDTGLYHE